MNYAEANTLHRLQLRVREAAREKHVMSYPRSSAAEISLAQDRLSALSAQALADLTSLEQQGALDDFHRLMSEARRT